MDRPNCPACRQAGNATHTTTRARQSQGSRTTTTWNQEPGTRNLASCGTVMGCRNKSLPHKTVPIPLFAIIAPECCGGGGKAFRGNLLIRWHGDRAGHHIKSFGNCCCCWCWCWVDFSPVDIPCEFRAFRKAVIRGQPTTVSTR